MSDIKEKNDNEKLGVFYNFSSDREMMNNEIFNEILWKDFFIISYGLILHDKSSSQHKMT